MKSNVKNKAGGWGISKPLFNFMDMRKQELPTEH